MSSAEKTVDGLKGNVAVGVSFDDRKTALYWDQTVKCEVGDLV